jgi:hypothetical protein
VDFRQVIWEKKPCISFTPIESNYVTRTGPRSGFTSLTRLLGFDLIARVKQMNHMRHRLDRGNPAPVHPDSLRSDAGAAPLAANKSVEQVAAAFGAFRAIPPLHRAQQRASSPPTISLTDWIAQLDDALLSLTTISIRGSE